MTAGRYRLRPDREATRIQLTDVAHTAGHFGVSPLAAVFRLKSLGLVTEAEREELQEADTRGDFAEFRCLLGLVTEAFCCQETPWSRGRKLAALAGMEEERFEELCGRIGLEPGAVQARMPGPSSPLSPA